MGNFITQTEVKIDRKTKDSIVEIDEAISYSEQAKELIQENQIVSLYFSKKYHLLFLSLDNGKLLFCKLENKGITLCSIISLDDECKSITGLTEINTDDNKLILVGSAHMSQIRPVIIQIEEKETTYQHVKNKADGIEIIQNKYGKPLRILVFNDESNLLTFSLKEAENVSINPSIIINDLQLSQLIDKAKLPHTVSMPIDFFEKGINIADTMSKKLRITGNICQVLGKDSAALIDLLVLNKEPAHIMLWQLHTNVDITLEDPDYVIMGIRIGVEQSPKQFLNVFNRKLQINKSTDICLCDAEIFSIVNNTLKFSLDSEDTPIKINKIDIYAIQKTQFHYNEKLANFEKWIMAHNPNKLIQFSDISQILQTKSIKSISWKTKDQLLKEVIPENSLPRKIISALDFFSLLCYTSSPLPIQQASEILEILSENAFMGEVNDNRSRVIQSAIRKCAKSIIFNVDGAQENVEGCKFNYYSFKTDALFKWLNKRFEKDLMNLQGIEKCLTEMKKLSCKARLVLSDCIYNNPHFLKEIGDRIKKAMAKENTNSVKRILENYVFLIIMWFDWVLNNTYYKNYKTTEKNLREISSAALLSDEHVNDIKCLLMPFLLDTNEAFNGIMFNCLVEQSQKHDNEYVHTSEKLIVKTFARYLYPEPNEDVMQDIGKFNLAKIEFKAFDFSFVLFAVTIRSIQMDCENDPEKVCVLLNFLYKLLQNIQTSNSQLESIGIKPDCYISEHLSILLRNYIIPTNIMDSKKSQCILLCILLFGKIFETKQNKQEQASFLFSDECILRKTFANLVQENVLLSYIIENLKLLHSQILKKIKADDTSEDINSQVHLLEPKNEFAKELWSLFFEKQQQEKLKLWENIEQQIAIALLDLAFNLGNFEKHLISKNSKPIIQGILLTDSSTGNLKEKVMKLKETACIFVSTPGIQPKLKEKAKRLFILLSKSKNELHEQKDQYLYSLTFQAIKLRIAEQDDASIYKNLNELWKISSKRPLNLKQYLKNNKEDFKFLFQVGKDKNNKIAFHALALICLALETGETSNFNIKTTYQNIQSANLRPKDFIERLKGRPLEANISMEEGLQYDEDIFKLALNFADTHVLSSANINLRFVAAHLLRGLWDSGDQKHKNEVIRIVIQKFSGGIHNYGFALLQLYLVAIYLVHKETEQKDAYIRQLCKIIYSEAQQAVNIMQQHENGEIYRQVQKMIGNKDQSGEQKDFTYCLDQIPCGVCAFEKEEPYISQKIGDIKEETKFNESGYIYKLSNSYSIQKVSLSLDLKGGKFVRIFNVYTSNSKTTDLAELKKNRSYWKKVGTATLKQDMQSCIIEFALPLISSLIQFEFIVSSGACQNISFLKQRSKYYDRNRMIQEHLPIIDSDTVICPRCTFPVSGMAGVCPQCGDNAFQCIHCHNINYDKLDAFVCTECGHSRYGKIDISLTVKQDFAPEKITSEKEKLALQAKLSNTMETAMKLHESLSKNRTRLQSIISSNSVKTSETGGSIVEMYDIYMNGCVRDYRKLVKLLQSVNAMKAELMLYRNQIIKSTEHAKLTISEKCYGCAEAYLQLFLKIIEITALLPLWAPTLYQLNTSNLLLCQVMPCLSPYLAQKLICSLVSLGLYSNEFASVIFEYTKASLAQIKSNCSLQRKKIVISIELLLQLHAKATKEIVIGQKVNKSINLLFSQANITMWNFLIAAAQNTKENLLCAEEVIQPILAYLNEILSMKFCSDIVLPQIMKAAICSENIIEKWAALPKISIVQYKENLMDSWIKDCLLHSECKLLRETMEKLLKKMLKKMPETIVPTTEGMINMLGKIFERNRDDTESFMSILRFCILELRIDSGAVNQQWAIMELMRHGDKELNKLLKIQENIQFREELLGEELWIGYTLFKMYEIVLEIAQTNDGKKIVSASREEIGYFAVGAYIKVKKLLLLANNYIEKTQQKIDEIFKNMQTENVEDRKKFIRQCILLLNENKGDEQASVFLYEELYKFVNPEKPEPVYSINLRKAHTQDMYIKGTMSKNPYSSSELGVTMKDLRSKICKNLGMTEAEEIMELLVGNQLIDLELPIKLVYEKVWWPFCYKKKNPETEEIPPIESANKSDLDPMEVIFRLAGIDGEATEKRVDNLNDSKAQEDPELAYAMTSVFADIIPAMSNESSSCLSIMLEHFSSIDSLIKQKVISERIIKLFSIVIKTKICRTKILELGGTNILAEKLVEFLPFYESAEGPIVDSLIIIVGDIINEANQSGTTLSVCSSVVDTGHITKIMERLINTCEKTESPKCDTKRILK